MQLCRQRVGPGTGRAACLALTWVPQEPLLAPLPVLTAFVLPRAGGSARLQDAFPLSRHSAPKAGAEGKHCALLHAQAGSGTARCLC